MRKILHLPFASKTDAPAVRPAFKRVPPRRDPEVPDPFLRLDAWRNEGGARRPGSL